MSIFSNTKVNKYQNDDTETLMCIYRQEKWLRPEIQFVISRLIIQEAKNQIETVI